MSKPTHTPEQLNEEHHLSLQLMQEYLQEALPAKEMHQVERHLLDCELCTDALEGLSFMHDPGQATDSIDHLKRKVRKRSLREPVLKRKKKKAPLLWRHMSVAAATIVLVVGSVLVFKINTRKETIQPVTLNKESVSSPESALPAAGNAAQQPPAYSDALPVEENTRARQKKETATRTNASPQALMETSPKEKTSTESTQGLPPEVAIDQIEEQLKDKDVIAQQEMESAEQVPQTTVAEARREEAAKLPLAKKQLSAPSGAVGITQNFITISGKVVAASDTTVYLPGVKVNIKGTSTSILTDYRGKFSLAAAPGSTLVFSMEGMQPAEIRVKDRKPALVLLKREGEEEATADTLSEELIEEDNLSFKPQPENGTMGYRSYLKKNLRYPEEARKNNIQGNVRIEFVVKPDGQLMDFAIKKGLGYGCDEEALRLVKEGPAWKPAIQNGKKVEKKITVFVPFKL